MSTTSSSHSPKPDSRKDSSHSHSNYSSSSFSLYLFAFLAIFILSFFPSVFQFLLRLPLAPFALFFPSSTSTKPQSHPQPHYYYSPLPPPTMSWTQKTFSLPSKTAGSYLITSHVEQSLPEIKSYRVGLLHLFVQHTSCALSLNENWDEDVRKDMTDALGRIVVEDKKGEGIYRHDAEGSDDMPAHIKSALVGASVSIPIKDGRLATGTWQGIWYLEFRKAKHTRNVVATIQGEKM